jgi:Transglycosylase SLT domain
MSPRIRAFLLGFMLAVTTAMPARADIPVVDRRHAVKESDTADNADKIKEVDKKRYAKSQGVTCSMYKKGNGPSSTSNANPEIVGLVKRIAREEGVSETVFLSLVYQESRFNPCAKSGVGAFGLTQLMPGTAKDLGVNPHDIESNLRGGARYFKQQLRKFGSVDLALAAYNSGPGNVSKYGGIPPFKETQGYVHNITQKWMPVFGGGAAGNIPLNYGGGKAFEGARDATIDSFAHSQSVGESQSNVKSWYEQLGEQYTGTIQDSWDQNSGARNANLEMLNQAILMASSLAELVNSMNALTASDMSGSSGSLRPRPDEPEPDPSGRCDPVTGTRWDEELQDCVLHFADPATPQLHTNQ